MGKRYYCDYCDKTMVAAPSIIRTHNKGVVHQKIVSEHYQQFKDAETILKEESSKKPCSRFVRGECQFGGICRYSHYTIDEITALREIVASKNRSHSDTSHLSFEDLYQKLQNEKFSKTNTPNEKNTVIYDNNGITHVLPWVYNPVFESIGDLPPSLKKIKMEDFNDVTYMPWGWK